ncbi:MAG: tetratricopeptide repeat protein [Tannerellaceae bacterium]|jgi:hypothetical protein|nr:tetratricopeptide repeat protein [Tannerellaceae bacterium]
MKASFYLLISCLLAACTSVRYMEIETYNPSEVTYPESVRKVLIVNNALPQPPDTGYEFKFLGLPQDTCKANADSALFDACRAFGTAIVEAGFFDDVLLFQETTRKDEAFYADVKLSPEEVESLCEETGTDAVISFDRLLFDMKKEVKAFMDGYVTGKIRVDIVGIVRSYLPGKISPDVTVLVSDSVFWSEEVSAPGELSLLLPAPNEALRVAGNYVGSKLYSVFVPHWNNEIRWYFTGSGARWKEATAYAVSEKWEQAAERWQYIYNNSFRWSDKAKSASNLALACEITARMEKALEWAEVSYSLFEKNKGKDYAHTQTQQFYTERLRQRVSNDKKLNLQFGEK